MQEIVTEAQHFEFNNAQPLQRWLRAAKMLLTEAAICEQDGNLQMAYLYLYRHAELVLAKFPQHPDYSDPKFKDELAQARKALKRNLVTLEQMKPTITQQHERYMKALERRKVEGQRVQDQRLADQQAAGSRDYDDKYGADYEDHSQALNASEHRELAVDLAHRELRRRDVTRQSTRQAGISPGTVASRRKGIVVGGMNASDMIDPRGSGPSSTTNADLQQLDRFLRPGDHVPQPRATRDHGSTGSFSYPSVPSKEQAMNWTSSVPPPSYSNFDSPPPVLPPKQSTSLSGPQLPPKSLDVPIKSTTTTTTSPQSKYTFRPTAFTESGSPLRTVLLPPDLRTTFLNLAHPNTLHNLETCGILCGTLIANALFINHLIIPDQHSTSDTCDTTEAGDAALFDYCDGQNLLVCGWIHTHPSQSCFLSSRDLHTSSGYQIMLPEAIAIVCAPRQNPDWGIFRLTDPPGLQAVLNCHKQGLFHPHEESHLYTDALRPGHVVEGPGLKFEVVDLRIKK